MKFGTFVIRNVPFKIRRKSLNNLNYKWNDFAPGLEKDYENSIFTFDTDKTLEKSKEQTPEMCIYTAASKMFYFFRISKII